jgi:hypothetical protein
MLPLSGTQIVGFSLSLIAINAQGKKPSITMIPPTHVESHTSLFM